MGKFEIIYPLFNILKKNGWDSGTAGQFQKNILFSSGYMSKIVPLGAGQFQKQRDKT